MRLRLTASLASLLALAAHGLACGGGVDVETAATSSGSSSAGTSSGSGASTGAGGASTTTSGAGGASTTSGAGGPSTTGAGGASTTTSGAGGAGGNEICPGFGDLCTTCLSTDCPATYCNCYDNPACFSLIQCLNGCNGAADCILACEQDNQSGISDVVLLTSCAGTTCALQCPNSGGDEVTPCTTCLLTACEEAANACLVEPECTALYDCLSTCPDLDLSCQQACYADHGQGTASLQALLQCGSQQCADPCK